VARRRQSARQATIAVWRGGGSRPAAAQEARGEGGICTHPEVRLGAVEGTLAFRGEVEVAALAVPPALKGRPADATVTVGVKRCEVRLIASTEVQALEEGGDEGRTHIPHQ